MTASRFLGQIQREQYSDNLLWHFSKLCFLQHFSSRVKQVIQHPATQSFQKPAAPPSQWKQTDCAVRQFTVDTKHMMCSYLGFWVFTASSLADLSLTWRSLHFTAFCSTGAYFYMRVQFKTFSRLRFPSLLAAHHHRNVPHIISGRHWCPYSNVGQRVPRRGTEEKADLRQRMVYYFVNPTQ